MGPIALSVALAIFTAEFCIAGDWPQILGPSRNGKAQAEHLANAWPAAGPKLVWSREVGSGYAGVAVVGGKPVVFHRVADSAIAECLDGRTGKPIWKNSFPTHYVSTIAPDEGPRCVPLVADGRVYLFGADGDTHCLALNSGRELWKRDLYQELHAPDGYFGAGSSPILDSGKLLINVGAPGAGIVALSPKTGETLWQATEEAASYSSPIAMSLNGARHVIFVTRLNVISLDPATGQVRFRFPFGMRGPTVNAANPLVFDSYLFVTSNYGIGARLSKLTPTGAQRVWESDDVLSSQYTTSIELDGHLYGIDGRQDAGVARLRCVDAHSGKVVWTEEGFGTATLILADGKLLIMKTDGHLVLASPSPTKYQQLASSALFSDTVQALPALSDGFLYARDTRTLKCYDLRPAR